MVRVQVWAFGAITIVGLCASLTLTAPIAGKLGASDSVNPNVSPADDLGQLSIPDGAEQRYGKERPLGDVVERCHQYLVDGEVVGERLFYKNGQLADEKLFRNKKLHGYWRQFHLNGQPFAERPYRDGLPDGIFRFWDENGKLLGESTLTKGTGLLSEFEKRELACGRYDTPYIDGRIHGKRKRWGNFDGTTKRGCNVTTFNRGVMEGWTYLLDDDGTLLAYSYIREGQLHGVSRKVTQNGENVGGYPKYWIAGKEVSEGQLRDAAKSDKILALTLTSKPDVEVPNVKRRDANRP